MDGTGRVVEAVPGPDHPGVEGTLSGGAELELRAATLDVPALLLLAVELEAQRVAGADEEGLAEIRIRVGPDQLLPPGLLDLARLDHPGVEASEVRRVDAHATRRLGRHSGCSDMNSSARRRSFGVFTVSQTP